MSMYCNTKCLEFYYQRRTKNKIVLHLHLKIPLSKTNWIIKSQKAKSNIVEMYFTTYRQPKYSSLTFRLPVN